MSDNSTRCVDATAASAFSWPPRTSCNFNRATRTANGDNNNGQCSSKTDEGDNITLPEALYWNYVRPFTPIKERKIVTKRCSTRFPPEQRMSIDDAVNMLRCTDIENDSDSNESQTILVRKRNATGDIKESRRETWEGYDTIKKSNPNDGILINKSWKKCNYCYFSEQLHFYTSEAGRTHDSNKVKEDLCNSRHLLDSHLLNIDSPPMRLLLCLSLGLGRVSFPSVFPGDGSIGLMIKHHFDTNPLALNGRLYRDPFNPPTILGYLVNEWINTEISASRKKAFEEIVVALLENGADASVFAKRTRSKHLFKKVSFGPIIRNTNRPLLWDLRKNVYFYNTSLERIEHAIFYRRVYNLLASNIPNKELLAKQGLPSQLEIPNSISI